MPHFLILFREQLEPKRQLLIDDFSEHIWGRSDTRSGKSAFPYPASEGRADSPLCPRHSMCHTAFGPGMAFYNHVQFLHCVACGPGVIYIVIMEKWKLWDAIAGVLCLLAYCVISPAVGTPPSAPVFHSSQSSCPSHKRSSYSSSAG